MRLDYPTAKREGVGNELDWLFDLCEAWNLRIGEYTQTLHPSDLCKYREYMLAQAFTLALSLEPLVDGGHAFAAKVLARSIFERVGGFNCLQKYPDEYITEWNLGWRHGKRPNLRKCLAEIPVLSVGSKSALISFLYTRCNELVHGGKDAVLDLYVDDGGDRALLISGPQLGDERAMASCRSLVGLALMAVLDASLAAYPEVFESELQKLKEASPQGGGEARG